MHLDQGKSACRKQMHKLGSALLKTTYKCTIEKLFGFYLKLLLKKDSCIQTIAVLFLKKFIHSLKVVQRLPFR